MMSRALCILALAVTVSGCERAGLFKNNAPLFDGHRFRTSLKAERKNRQTFSVTVHGVSKSRAGAVGSGEYKAVQHCIEFFGTSDIDWTVGPDTDLQALPVVNDTLTLKGSCRDV